MLKMHYWADQALWVDWVAQMPVLFLPVTFPCNNWKPILLGAGSWEASTGRKKPAGNPVSFGQRRGYGACRTWWERGRRGCWQRWRPMLVTPSKLSAGYSHRSLQEPLSISSYSFMVTESLTNYNVKSCIDRKWFFRQERLLFAQDTSLQLMQLRYIKKRVGHLQQTSNRSQRTSFPQGFQLFDPRSPCLWRGTDIPKCNGYVSNDPPGTLSKAHTEQSTGCTRSYCCRAWYGSYDPSEAGAAPERNRT